MSPSRPKAPLATGSAADFIPPNPTLLELLAAAAAHEFCADLEAVARYLKRHPAQLQSPTR